MKRYLLLELLQNYHPIAHEERVFKQDMLTFIRQYPDCFERSLQIGHITGSAWIVNQRNTHALLMHHTKLDRWLQLGGHCDGDHDVRAVALKEAQEESGSMCIELVMPEIFDLDIHLIPANSREKEHYHYDVRFLLRVTNESAIQKNSESKALQWISKDAKDLPTDNPSIVRMFKKWINI